MDFNMPTIITKRNVDSNGNPISVKIVELRQISTAHSCVVLSQIPDELNRVIIEGFTEVFDIEKLDKKNFKVDYSQGIVYFHPFNIGKSLTIEYYGLGYELISVSRIFSYTDKNGRTIETLEEILDRSKLQLDLVESLGGAIKVIEKLDENVKSANNLNTYFDEKIPVATGLKNELDGLVTDAKGWKDQLKQDVADGKILQPLLEQTVNDGNTTKQQLDQSIANAQDDIAKIEATGNEIINITSTEWVYNETRKMYEKQITHTCNSENIHITCKTSDTKEGLHLPWKIVDKSNILLKSEEAIGVNVIISARYYKPLTDNTTTQEVIDARKGELTLLDKMNKVDEQLEQNKSEINYLKTQSTSINNRIEHFDKMNSILSKIGSMKRIRWIGDSMSVGHDATGAGANQNGEIIFNFMGDIHREPNHESIGYVNRLRITLQNFNPSLKLINASMSGRSYKEAFNLRSGYMLNVNDKDDLIVFNLGTNDTGMCTSVDEFKEYVNNFISYAKEYANDVIVLTAPPLLYERIGEVDGTQQNILIRDINRTIKGCCYEQNVFCIDLYSEIMNSFNTGDCVIHDFYKDDRTHPNDLGHTEIFKILQRYFGYLDNDYDTRSYKSLNWREIELLNNWKNSGITSNDLKFGVGFTNKNTVAISGIIYGGTVDNNTVIATIPLQYCPKTTQYINALTNDNGEVRGVLIQVNTDGRLTIMGIAGSNWININSLIYI